MKRFISLLLALVLFGASLIGSVSAEDASFSGATVTVNCGGKETAVNVLQNQEGDFLVPVTWITYYGAMKCAVDDDRYVFCYPGQDAGREFCKRIFISKNGSAFDITVRVNHADLSLCSGKFSDSIIYNGTLYLPLAEILPFINAKVGISKEGTVLIYPNCISLFQALYNAGINNLIFDADYDIAGGDLLGGSAYILDSFIGFRFDRIFFFADSQSADYEKLFKSYLTDDEVYLSAFDKETDPVRDLINETVEFFDKGETVLKEVGSSVYKLVDEIGMPEELYDDDFYRLLYKDFEAVDIDGVKVKVTGLDFAEAYLKIADYYVTYNNQVDDHRKMLMSIIPRKSSKKDKANPVYAAAKRTTALYGDDVFDKLKAASSSALKDFVKKFCKSFVKEKVTGDALGQTLAPYKISLAITKLIIPDEFKTLNDYALIGHMDNIVSTAYDAVLSYKHDCNFTTENLDNMRLSAIMTLIASRNAFKSIWNEDYDRIERVDALLRKLYLAADGVECDSSDYYGRKRDELRNGIDKIKAKAGEDNGEKLSLIASDIEADYIQYIDFEEDPFDIFLYWKDGKLGIIDKKGDIVEKARWDGFQRVPYDKIFIWDEDLAKDNSKNGVNGYWVTKDGSLTEGYFLGGCGGDMVDLNIYWDENLNKPYVFKTNYGELSAHYEYSYEEYSKEYYALKPCGVIRKINGWTGGERTGQSFYKSFSPNLTSEKYALFDLKTGSVISDYIYDDYFEVNEHVFMISQNGKWRMIDPMTDYIDGCEYDSPRDAYDREFGPWQNAFVDANGYIVTKVNGKFGLSDAYGKHIIEPTYKNISFVSYDGVFWVQNDDDKWDLMQLTK